MSLTHTWSCISTKREASVAGTVEASNSIVAYLSTPSIVSYTFISVWSRLTTQVIHFNIDKIIMIYLVVCDGNKSATNICIPHEYEKLSIFVSKQLKCPWRLCFMHHLSWCSLKSPVRHICKTVVWLKFTYPHMILHQHQESSQCCRNSWSFQQYWCICEHILHC